MTDSSLLGHVSSERGIWERGYQAAHDRNVSDLTVRADAAARTTFQTIGDFFAGIGRSRVFRALVITGVAIGGLFALASNPAGWMIAAVAAGAFVVSMVGCVALDGGFQQTAFELTALQRLMGCRGENYNEVYRLPTGERLFLGALPNRIGGYGEKLVQRHGVKATLSINEPWERAPFGLSQPYTARDWNDLGVTYGEITVFDHTLLSFEQLDQAADFIHANVAKHGNAYVHCRAGVGRSAMAIAAYLIKHQGKSADEAARIIKAGRPQSTIMKKLADKPEKGEQGLRSYQAFCASRARES